MAVSKINCFVCKKNDFFLSLSCPQKLSLAFSLHNIMLQRISCEHTGHQPGSIAWTSLQMTNVGDIKHHELISLTYRNTIKPFLLGWAVTTQIKIGCSVLSPTAILGLCAPNLVTIFDSGRVGEESQSDC